jgi:uncharacterized protein (TIGR02679 family)
MSTHRIPPAGHADADHLATPDGLDDAAVARIRTVLGQPSWRWLTGAVRAAWERDLSRRSVRLDLSALPDAEAAAMADFLLWPTHRIGTTTISLIRLDRLLRSSGLAAGLAACLTASSGPLHDEAGQRRADKAARRAASDQLWAEAVAHSGILRHPQLHEWLAEEWRTGRMPADTVVRRQVITDALAVLAVLPDPGTGLARLASHVLGDAHALDDGPVQAAVLRALSWLADRKAGTSGAARKRELWASVGVALDTVSSTVLVLGLTLPGRGPAVTSLAANAEAGIPARLTLGQLRHYLDAEQIPSARRQRAAHVCENPSVLETVAEALGAGSGPLICVEGRPSVAAGLLLQELLSAGTMLRYHGDFDWAGLAIARSLIGAGAQPWRLSTSDYRRGLHRNGRQKKLPPPASPVTTPWDPSLAGTMLKHQVAVEEEAVINDLLSDLSSAQQ